MLSPGDRLGPYEVVSALGAGGMGEVYRARDVRLGRDVALKVLPEVVTRDHDRLERFEREARALAALEHPNILALHDVEMERGQPYLVVELVGGQTLRQKLGNGPLPPRKAVEYAVQICRGLAAAHDRGIVHRDLKPENLSLTGDGRIKILDFGLARLTEALGPGSGEGASAATESGVTLGTAGYMSPEQARGEAVDVRSDLFSLGAVLYEMLSGRRAFDGATPADRIASILASDPPDLSAAGGTSPPLLAPIVRRCLEKDARDRFQTARDLEFALSSLTLDASLTPNPRAAAVQRRLWLGVGGVLLAVLAAGALLRAPIRTTTLPRFEQLTFRRGMVLDARFTADGNTVVYGGLFDGQPAETYSIHKGRKESMRLGLPPARLCGVSSTGELALVLGRPDEKRMDWYGTLARVPLSGGAPRELAEGVFAADWAPDGDLAAIRRVRGERQLEYPLGHVIRRPLAFGDAGFALRVSPDGQHIALAGAGGVTVFDRDGRTQVLAANREIVGLAWDPSGSGVWVGLSGQSRESTDVARLGLDGSLREATRFPGVVMVHDVARDGRMLVHAGFERGGVRALGPDNIERDLCPLSFCQYPTLGSDGERLAIWDWSANSTNAAWKGWTYLRSTRGGPAIRLGEGRPLALSPDGARVLVLGSNADGTATPELLATGPGEPGRLNADRLSGIGPGWVTDQGRVFVVADDSSGDRRTFLLSAGTPPVAVTPPGVRAVGAPFNGRLLASASNGALAWYALDGGKETAVSADRLEGTTIAGMTADGRFLFEGELGVPGRIHRLDLETSHRVLWRVVQPGDTAGFVLAFNFSVSRDGRSYAYAYLRLLQDLFVVDGIR